MPFRYLACGFYAGGAGKVDVQDDVCDGLHDDAVGSHLDGGGERGQIVGAVDAIDDSGIANGRQITGLRRLRSVPGGDEFGSGSVDEIAEINAELFGAIVTAL